METKNIEEKVNTFGRAESSHVLVRGCQKQKTVVISDWEREGSFKGSEWVKKNWI